ncbi:MAG: zinc ribbon domain-containing protein [Paraprevotella sp.]|nr:zinc ribbon domain-containing protein [Paraprevotella sp.]
MTKLKCPDCGRRVKADMDACPACGRKIAGATTLCPSCGQLVSDRRRVCPACHVRMEPGGAAGGRTARAEGSRATGGGGCWRGFLLVTGAALLLALAGGGWLWWRRQQAEERERRAYALLDGCLRTEVYREFVRDYPDSPLLEDVVRRMREVEAVAEAWDVVCRKDTRQAYADFAEAHVDSPYYRMCLARVDSIDWAEADREATPAAYARYMARHPHGIYAEDAAVRRKTQEELRVTPEELAMLKGLFNTYFAALTRRDEGALRGVLAFLTLRYWGHDNASQDYAVERMKRMYDGSDVRRISFVMRDEWRVEKEIVRPYRYAYSVDFRTDALYDRARAERGRHAVFRVEAHVSVDRKIDRLELHREEEGK